MIRQGPPTKKVNGPSVPDRLKPDLKVRVWFRFPFVCDYEVTCFLVE